MPASHYFLNSLNRPETTVVWPEPPSIVAARSKIAMRLSWMTSVLGLALFAVDRVIGTPVTADSMMTLVLAVMGALAWGLLKVRRYNSVAWLLVVFLFGMAAASTYFYGSVRTINIVLLLMGQVAAGIFLSRRGLLWATAAAVALLGLLTWADAAGLLSGHPRFAVSWRNWLSQCASLVGVAAMMFLNRTQVRLAQDLHLREATRRLQSQLDRDLGQGRFSRLFRASPTPIFVQSMRTGAILDVNLAFESVLGYTRKEVLNRRDSFLWRHDDAYAAFSQDRRAHRRTGWHAITGIGRNGQHVNLQICSERDDGSDDGLRITVLRAPGFTSSAMPTVYAPLEGGFGG